MLLIKIAHFLNLGGRASKFIFTTTNSSLEDRSLYCLRRFLKKSQNILLENLIFNIHLDFFIYINIRILAQSLKLSVIISCWEINIIFWPLKIFYRNFAAGDREWWNWSWFLLQPEDLILKPLPKEKPKTYW